MTASLMDLCGGNGYILGEVLKVPESYNGLNDEIIISLRDNADVNLSIILPRAISKKFSFIRLQDLIFLKLKSRSVFVQYSPPVIEFREDLISDFEVHTVASKYENVVCFNSETSFLFFYS